MLLKAALFAASVLGYANSAHFQYQVECIFQVKAVANNLHRLETWYSTKEARENYDSLSASMSAGGKYGLVRANVAAAMSKVSSARSSTERQGSRKELSSQEFQGETNQVVRSCTHHVNIDGQVLSYTETLPTYTERTGYESYEYWQKMGRDYINDNLVKQFSGAKPISSGNTLIVAADISTPTSNGWWIQKQVTVANGHWGDWGTVHMCPKDQYASFAKVCIEEKQGGDDDTGINGLQMNCSPVKGRINGKAVIDHRSPYLITEVGHWGDWTVPEYCATGSFISGFKAVVEPMQGSDDDTAMNGLAMACKWSVTDYNGPSTYDMPYGHYFTKDDAYHHILANHGWGSWGNWATCPDKMYVCGFQLRTEENQHRDDDTSVNGLRMQCCRMPWDT